MRGHFGGQCAQDREVERQIGDLEAGRESFRFDHLGLVLVAAEHEPATRVAHVDARFEEPNDGLERLYARDGLRDIELMAYRYERDEDPRSGCHAAAPGAGRVHDDGGVNLAAGRRDSLHPAIRTKQSRHPRERKHARTQLARTLREAHGNPGGIEPAVRRDVADRTGRARLEVRSERVRFPCRDEPYLDSERACDGEIGSQPRFAGLGVRRLEAARPVEVDVASELRLETLERLAGLVPERGHDRRRGRLAGEASRPGGRLRAHGVLIDEHHVCAAAREVVGSAGAEGASADHDRRRRLHGEDHSIGPAGFQGVAPADIATAASPRTWPSDRARR